MEGEWANLQRAKAARDKAEVDKVTVGGFRMKKVKRVMRKVMARWKVAIKAQTKAAATDEVVVKVEATVDEEMKVRPMDAWRADVQVAMAAEKELEAEQAGNAGHERRLKERLFDILWYHVKFMAGE